MTAFMRLTKFTNHLLSGKNIMIRVAIFLLFKQKETIEKENRDGQLHILV